MAGRTLPFTDKKLAGSPTNDPQRPNQNSHVPDINGLSGSIKELCQAGFWHHANIIIQPIVHMHTYLQPEHNHGSCHLVVVHAANAKDKGEEHEHEMGLCLQ
jgi:hypothetical protein